jgi:hypothetical protein
MDIQKIVAAPEWMLARKALMQELNRMRDQFASDMWVPNQPLVPLLAGAGEEGFTWAGCLDRLESFLADLCAGERTH